MSDTGDDLADYRKDSRMPCRYGAKCYQKNSAHRDKYKHPPQKPSPRGSDDQGPSKKRKLNNVTEEKPKVESPKQECISESDNDSDEITTEVSPRTANSSKDVISESSSESEPDHGKQKMKIEESAAKLETGPALNHKDFIKAKFLVDMPPDFYNFWDYCKELKPNNPTEALREINLKLVGPYDVLAGKFEGVTRTDEDFLRHWRYYYDPPEFQTVLKGDDKTGYHIGYFRDSPDEQPALVAGNHGLKDGDFTKMGDNIFSAVHTYLEQLKKIGDPFTKMHVKKYQTSLANKAKELLLSVTSRSEKIKKRDLKVVGRTCNRLGLVVPYNRRTQLGYRELAMSDKDLSTILRKLKEAAPEQKKKYLSDLQPVLTYTSIALDECDFGTGVKLGWDILYHGVDTLNLTVSRFLSTSYELLNRHAFAQVAKAHMENRKKGCNLSVL